MGKIAIVGGGIIGLSVARELHLAGKKVEVFDPAPGSGASLGNSRIFRQNHDDPRLVELSKRNKGLWSAWEEISGKRLINPCSLFFFGPNAKQRFDLLKEENIKASWKKKGEILPDKPGFIEEEAGSIFCPDVFSFLLGETAPFIKKEKVAEVSGRGITLASGKKKKYDLTLVASGDTLPELMPEWSKKIGLRVEPHLRIDFVKKINRFPAWIDHYDGFYGLPGKHVYSIGQQETSIVKSEKMILQTAKKLARSLDPTPIAYTVCNSVQIGKKGPLGEGGAWRVYSESNLFAFAGSNSYKWAPLHGQEIANLLLGKSSSSWLALSQNEN